MKEKPVSRDNSGSKLPPASSREAGAVTAKTNTNPTAVKVAGLPAPRDWTQGSITGSLWGLAWPIIISSSLNNLGPVIDAIWVGKLGSAAVAGVGVAGMIVGVVLSLIMGLFMGLGALVARAIGANDKETAVKAARQGIMVGIFMSIILAIIGAFFSRHFLRIFGLAPDVVAAGAAYLSIQFIGMVTMVFEMLTNSVMQASGDTMNPMRIALVARALAIALSPCFVFGLGIFPELGVRGPAVASVVSFFLGGSIGVWLLFSGRTRLKLTLDKLEIDFPLIWRMVKIGLPAAVNFVQMNIVAVVVMEAIAPFGTVAVAAQTICSRVEMLFMMPAMGFGQAASVLTGQNLGAGKPERAEKGGWIAALLVNAIIAVLALVVVISSPQIMRIFSNDPQVIKIGATFLRIAGAGYIVIGGAIVLSSCLNGAGDTLIPMATNMVSMWAIQVPLAFLLPGVSSIGIYGIRWAGVISIWLRAIAFVVYFRTGRWKRRKV